METAVHAPETLTVDRTSMLWSKPRLWGGFVNFKCRLKCVIIGWLHRRHIETAATAVNVGVIPKLLTPNPPQKYWGEDVAAVGGGGSKVD